MIVISKNDLQQQITISQAIEATQQAFMAYAAGSVVMPDPFVVILPDQEGELCVKTALANDLPTYTIKQVSVMHANKRKGLPTLNSTWNVYDRATGGLLAVIHDEGWLTHLRTACAGAIAERLFRKKDSKILGIVGAGTQAEWQIKAVLFNNAIYQKIILWNRTNDCVRVLQKRISTLYPKLTIDIASSISELVGASDTVISVTAAQHPIITRAMVQQGITIVSVGSDMPEKCELDPRLYAMADKIFVDSIRSNVLLGGVKRSIDEGTISKDDITGEIGHVLNGKKKGRQSDSEIILVSLVGTGAQDAYVGERVYQHFKR